MAGKSMPDRYGAGDASDNLYCPTLPKDTTEEQVRLIFSQMGEVTQCKVLVTLHGEGRAALIRFSSVEAATQVIAAVESMGGMVEGFPEPITVRYAVDSRTKGKGKGDKGGGYGKGGYDGGYGKGGYDAGYGKQGGYDAGKGYAASSPYGAGKQGGGMAGKGGQTPSDNLYVQKMPGDTTPEEMLTVFSGYGTVVDTRITFTDGVTATGLVRFSSVQEATEVKETLTGNLPQGYERGAEPLQIKFADPPKWAREAAAAGGGAGGWQDDSWGSKGGKGAVAGVGGWQDKPLAFSMKTVVKGFILSGLPGANQESVELFVRGLPTDCEDTDLFRLFSPFGAISPKGCKVMTAPDGACKGFGFVNYQDTGAADLAIEVLNGTLMPDNKTELTVQYKSPPKHVQPVAGLAQPAAPAQAFAAPAMADSAANALLGSMGMSPASMQAGGFPAGTGPAAAQAQPMDPSFFAHFG